MVEEQELSQKLRDLTAEFTNGLNQQWAVIESAWTQLLDEGAGSPAAEKLAYLLHALNGTAGSLGFEQIRQAAATAEGFFRSVRDSRSSGQNVLEESAAAMELLERAVQERVQVNIQDLIRLLDSSKTLTNSLQQKRADRLIYMVEDDPIQAADLAAQIGYFGYSVRTFTSLDPLEGALRETLPAILLMDVSFPEGMMAGYDRIEWLQNQYIQFPPVIFITVHDSVLFRLQSVRVGGQAFFPKPVDVSALVDRIDQLAFHENESPYRVMVVEDSRVQANYITAQLKKAGFTTEVVADPLQVIDQLIHFNPDLLLLDMYMPDCTGAELARVIRQMEQFVSIPIVFLSSETDRNKQLEAMGIGGDDFLTKPIEPAHLISSVKTRIERYRRMRGLMIHDGLTGLLNHRTTKERLIQETERARRQGETMVFAIIDLDHFKQVNDTYGHASGDRVLRSVANMLRQRLRSSDTIGRFGGEEFAVILPNTTEENAVRILAEICEGFARVRHHSGQNEFSVTFSCGVSSFPAASNAEAVSNLADMAMYAAKAAGRNQVMPASACVGNRMPVENRATSAFQQGGLSYAALYQNLVRHSRNAILRFNPSGRVAYANEHALATFGFLSDEIQTRPVTETFFSFDAQAEARLQELIIQMVQSPSRNLHFQNETHDLEGHTVWYAWDCIPLTDEYGNLVEILAIGNDITTQVKTETELSRTTGYLVAVNRISQQLTSQKDLLAAIRTVAQEVVTLFNAQHVGISFLREESRMLEFIGDSDEGWNLDEGVLNRLPLDVDAASRKVVESTRAHFFADAMNNPLTSGNHALLRKHHIHGRAIVPLAVSGRVVGTMNIDFADERRELGAAELELAETIAGAIAGSVQISSMLADEQRQRQFFEALVRTLPVAVVMIDPEERIVSWNPAAVALFGYSPDEAVGKNIDDLLSSEELRQEAVQLTRQSKEKGDIIHAFTRRKRKDGSQAEVELLAVSMFMQNQLIGSIAIYHDIGELQAARREAEAANEAKSSFLAMMSHEIRTPLNAIVGMTTLLLETRLSPEQRDYCETVRSSSDALLAIINDILDFSKIEAGKMDLEEQPFDLRECVESAFDLVATRAAEKTLDLAYQMEPDVPPFVTGDSTRLRQILLNLLSNAIKFTQQGEIVLSVTLEPDSSLEILELHFALRDTGIGIPPDRMNRLFRSFSQVDASTTRKYGGTGLGLAISKRLSELMGGTMWAESEGVPGKGSIFHFSIRARIADHPIPVFLDGEQPELDGRRVLVVDDNATNRYIVVRQVQSWGMQTEETGDPRQALTWIRSGREYDLVLLDMQMPEMDGATLSNEIRAALDNPSGLPLVMLTSLGIREMETRGARLDAVLTKPIKPAVLYTTLLKVLGAPVPQRVRDRSKPSGEPVKVKTSALRILLAEDMMVNQKVALLLLERIGYRADAVSNGLEVLEALRRQPYDVVLMDVQMPEMDGLDATREIRATMKVQPYIIAMTANAMQGDREACMAAGMDDYISKPIQLGAVEQALQRAAAVHVPAPGSEDVPSSPPREPVIDLEVFQQFADSLGEENRDLVRSLLVDYLTEGEQLLADFHLAAECGDLEKARRMAHSLKSSSQMLGALQLAELCKTLEIEARSGNLDALKKNEADLDREFSAVKASLQKQP